MSYKRRLENHFPTAPRRSLPSGSGRGLKGSAKPSRLDRGVWRIDGQTTLQSHVEVAQSKTLDTFQEPKSAEKPRNTDALETLFTSLAWKKPFRLNEVIGNKTLIGYNSHGEWSTLKEIRDVELERSNVFPDLTRFPDDTPAIWVNLTRRKALRYLADAEQWEHIDSEEPLTKETRGMLEEINSVTLKPTDVIAFTDGDEGYLVLRSN